MKTRLDWKDVANSYYEKSMTLSVLFMLFSFLVTPEIQVKPYEGGSNKTIEAYEYVPEVKPEVKPPAETRKPVIDIVIEDDFAEEDEEELKILDTIENTVFEMNEEIEPPAEEVPSKFFVCDEAPVVIKRVTPKYPKFAKTAGIEGTVVLEVVVKKDGTVGKIEIVKSLMSGPDGLDEAAVQAMKQTIFQPAKANGKPVAVWVTLPITFKLNN